MPLTLTSSAFDQDGPVPRSFAHSSGDATPPLLGYLGPAPPSGDPPRHYVFRLLAVDAPIEVKGNPSYSEVEAATDGHVLATATLIGTYRS